MNQNKHPKVFTETALIDKLGVSVDMKIYTINAPDGYTDMLGNLPDGVEILTQTERKVDFVHIFVTNKDSLPIFMKAGVNHLYSMGALWISWPREEDKTNLTEQFIKSTGFQLGLKDEKSTIINDDWSGIMFRQNGR
jgi:hypothetical protein